MKNGLGIYECHGQLERFRNGSSRAFTPQSQLDQFQNRSTAIIARWSARSGTTGRSGTGVNTDARLRSGTVPVPKLWCEHGPSGVKELLDDLDTNKATGPETVTVLQNLPELIRHREHTGRLVDSQCSRNLQRRRQTRTSKLSTSLTY